MPTPERPVAQYRREFAQTLLAQRPSSVLDVGCGDGTLLRELQSKGVEVTGVEVEAARVDALSHGGIAARLASADALPFPNAAFDWVVMQYTAHHIARLPEAIAECWRVARTGLLVLDPWFDVSTPSQALALDFDRWSKRVDRRCGEIHNDCLTAEEILGPLATATGTEVEVRHLLALVPVALEEMRAHVERQLARVASANALRHEAQALLARAERDGVSDDGAILIKVRRR